MMWSETVGDEVYVYWRGVLIYKRWLRLGYGVVMEAYGPAWQAGGHRRADG